MTRDVFTRLVRNYGTFFAQHARDGDPYADLFAILQLTHVRKGKLGLVVQLDATKEDSGFRLAKFYDAVFAGIHIGIEHFTMQAGEHAPKPAIDATRLGTEAAIPNLLARPRRGRHTPATIALIAVLTTTTARRRAALTVLKILVRARQPPATVDDVDRP